MFQKEKIGVRVMIGKYRHNNWIKKVSPHVSSNLNYEEMSQKEGGKRAGRERGRVREKI